MPPAFRGRTSTAMHNPHSWHACDAGKFCDAIAEIKIFEVEEKRGIKSCGLHQRAAANQHEAATDNLGVAYCCIVRRLLALIRIEARTKSLLHPIGCKPA